MNSSKWIFQVAVILCFLCMSIEGYKCHQCFANDDSCKTAKQADLKECDCKFKNKMSKYHNELERHNQGCSKDDDTPTWVGCYSQSGFVLFKEKNEKIKISLRGCLNEKKTSCEAHNDDNKDAKLEVKMCHCDMEGCVAGALKIGVNPTCIILLSTLIIFLNMI